MPKHSKIYQPRALKIKSFSHIHLHPELRAVVFAYFFL